MHNDYLFIYIYIYIYIYTQIIFWLITVNCYATKKKPNCNNKNSNEIFFALHNVCILQGYFYIWFMKNTIYKQISFMILIIQ